MIKKNLKPLSFAQQVKKLTTGTYELVSEYKDMNTIVSIKHKDCGTIFQITPNDFILGIRCPNCGGNIKRKHNEFVETVKRKYGEEYSVLSTYENSYKKILLKHNECGHEWETTPPSFLRGRKCPICAYAKRRKAPNEFLAEVFDLVGNEYEVLGEYTNRVSKIPIKHNKCGFEWNVTPNSFLRNHRCPKCSKVLKKTTESFKKEVFDLVGNEYEVLGEYINIRTKIPIKHNKCGFEWNVNPHNFLQGSRCPYCFKQNRKIV